MEDGSTKREAPPLEPQSAKRQRYDAANKVLRKPFKSPLRAAARATTGLQSPPKLTTATLPALGERIKPIIAPARHTYIARRPAKERAAHTTEGLALLKERNELERLLQLANDEADLVSQAQRILKDKKLQDLDVATIKWRDAARQLTETLFERSSLRIDRLGGIESWKEEKRKRREWANEGFEGDSNRQESQEDEGDKTEEPDEYESVTEFTIDIMLKELNIDPQILGYSIDLQKWVG